MENNNFSDNLQGESANAKIRNKEVKVVMLGQYVSKDDIGYYSKEKETIVDGEYKTEKVIYKKTYHCGCEFEGKENYGSELTEAINNDYPHLKRLVKQQGYFIVCKNCLKECAQCGRLTSRISGGKINGTWLCHKCKKETESQLFWQKLRNIQGGMW